ncbi:uncharacterized protein LOC125570185 [Nematostella vectensis]|uniref:uncharacterized protein LOC125570185 n=1 Tax=Nematostella vectensis TaxID=45351 RepID=UPI0020779750|nr:uncharacterized protein LOC125570185 [Nematostella vectensis]
MTEAKFNLRSWASNSQPLLHRATLDGVNDANCDSVNVLGLRWDTSTDTLTLACKELLAPDDTLVTKREILRESSKIYDPLGLITPISIRAKILIQDLWKLNVDWDEPLNGEIRTRWLSIAQEIRQSTNLTIPRCYLSNRSANETTQVHVFVDDSPKAYGAVAYIRQANQSSFVMAKSRVAPVKELSLPRLELMAALAGANLAEYLLNSLQKNFPDLQAFFWSDSQIVLNWLHSNKQLQQFVGNRVREIKRLSQPSSWRYCPTRDNPADLLTRGLITAELQASTAWLHGPSWITSECDWPTWESSTTLLVEIPEEEPKVTPEPDVLGEQTNSETDANSVENPSISTIMDPTRHSTLRKLQRVTALVLRFVHNLRNPTDSRNGPLMVTELTKAERTWIHDRQRHS